jgi:hypothetical protein
MHCNINSISRNNHPFFLHFAETLSFLLFFVDMHGFFIFKFFDNEKHQFFKITNDSKYRESGLNITAGQRTMTGQNCLLTVHFFTSPFILTGRIFIPFLRILNRFFSSAYDVCWNIVLEKLYISSRVRNFTVSTSTYVRQNWQRLSIYNVWSLLPNIELVTLYV